MRTAKLMRHTEFTTIDRKELRRKLDEIRRTGVSVSVNEMFIGSAGVSAPIYGIDGKRHRGDRHRCTDRSIRGGSGQAARHRSRCVEARLGCSGLRHIPQRRIDESQSAADNRAAKVAPTGALAEGRSSLLSIGSRFV